MCSPCIFFFFPTCLCRSATTPNHDTDLLCHHRRSTPLGMAHLTTSFSENGVDGSGNHHGSRWLLPELVRVSSLLAQRVLYRHYSSRRFPKLTLLLGVCVRSRLVAQLQATASSRGRACLVPAGNSLHLGRASPLSLAMPTSPLASSRSYISGGTSPARGEP